MALELNYEEERLGVTLPNVYAKIARASFDNMENDDGVNVQYTVKLYKNEEAKEAGEHPFGGMSFFGGGMSPGQRININGREFVIVADGKPVQREPDIQEK